MELLDGTALLCVKTALLCVTFHFAENNDAFYNVISAELDIPEGKVLNDE